MDRNGVVLGVAEDRIEPVPGETLQISLDYNIQAYCEQAALKVMEEKQAASVSVILMNPQNGEIYALVNVPEFNLNEPFELNAGTNPDALSDEGLQDELNRMWRNGRSPDPGRGGDPCSSGRILWRHDRSACSQEYL